MSDRISIVREHKVWTQMSTLGPVLDKAIEVPEVSADAIGDVERLRTVLAFVGRRLASTDSQLQRIPQLDGLASALSAAQGEVEQFISTVDAAHLAPANSHIDEALSLISQVPGPATPEELTALAAASASYRGTLDREQRAIRTEYESLRSQQQEARDTFTNDLGTLRTVQAELSASLQTEKERLSRLISEQQEQFASAQAARTADFSTSLQTALGALTQLTSEHQKQFSTSQETRKQRLHGRSNRPPN
jgi:chromosome segregation ATPase